MKGVLILLIVILCSSCIIKKPEPQEKDWLKIYKKELKIAKENDDFDAWVYFWGEYTKELKKRHK